MATNAQAIGVVSAARGEVFARAADGQIRRLAVGDQIFEGDVIVTASGSSAEITTFDGPVLSVAEQQTMAVDDQVLTTAPDATAGAVSPLDSTEAARVIQTVNPDANALLEDEAAAAGLTAGDTSEGGHNFVDLLRIVEAVPTAAYAFPTNPTGVPPVIEGELGVPTTPVISVNVQIGDTVTTPIEGGGVPIINLPPGIVAVGASGAMVPEGSSGGYVPVTFYITLDKAFTQDVTVTYRIDPGTATYGNPAGNPPVPGGDFFDGGLTGTVTIPAGYIGFAVTENIVGDKVVEPNETFTITLVSANGAAINPSAASAVVTIVNDDFAPVAGNDAITIADPSASGATNVLTNDSDQNGDSLSVTAPVTVVNEFGTLTIGTNGAATFVLNEAGQAMAKALDAGQSHVITFNNVYQATDGFNPSNPASVTVTVLGINDPPTITVNPPVGGQSIVYEAGLDGGSQLGPVTTSTSGSFTLADPDGVPDIKTVSVVVGSETYTVNIGDLAGHAFQGTQGILTVTAFNAQTGVASYTYQLTNPVTSSPASNDGGNTEAQGDVFTLTTSDGDVSSAPATITIAIVDDVPVAVGDGTQTVVEDGLLSVTGNVLSNDSYGADLPGTFAWDANTAAKAALAQYGTLTLGTDGTYTFVLNNASAAVQGLAAGQTVSQTLTYLITDKDGDSSPASVTIEIKGTADTANVTVSASGVDATVYEAGLTSVADTSETATGHSFQVSATDGIASVTVGTTTFTVEQLQNAAYLASHPIDTGEGTLVLTGYSSADGKTGTVTYDYTLNAAQMHIDNPATPANEGQVLQDSVAVGVSGVGGTSAGANLTINIVDDVPVAVGDGTQTVVEDGLLSVTGNVLSNDSYGADLPGTFAWDANTAAKAALAQYGTLTLGTDGTYTFVLNNASAAVQGLAAGQTVSQTLTYLITDKDGDSSPASVTIEIKGTADTANVTVSASGVDATVYEAGLTSVADTSETATGHSFQVSATDGIASVTVGTTTFTVEQLQNAAYLAGHPIDTGEGTLVLTGYSSADGKTGTVTYDYTLNAAQMHIDNPATPANEGQVLQDSVAVGVSGVGGTSAGANLTINIVDDVPVDASMDGFLRNTGGGELLGTLVDFGADGARTSDFVDWTSVSTKITTSSGTTVQSLTSMGENVIISTNGNVVTGTTADGDSVFTITANADGTYAMHLDRAIDTGRLFQTDGTLLTYGDGPIHGYYLYKEGADPLVGFTSGQAPDPNLTLLATFTGTSTGGGGHANEVNISGSGIGIADNNLNVGDTMSIDLADSQNFTAVKVSFAGFNSHNSVDYTINYVGGGSSTGTATIANGHVDSATGDMFLQAEAGKVIDSVVLNDVVGSPFKIDGMNFFQTADDKVPSIDLTYKAYDADNDSVTGTVSVTLDASNPVNGSLTLGSAIGGAAGNDDLHGGSGADILTGGGGSDNLWGGAGADTFVFKLSDSPNGTVDTVKDFTKGTGGDTLLFEDVLKVDVSYDSHTGNSTVVAHYADGQAQAVLVEGVQLNEAGTTILASTDHIIKITG